METEAVTARPSDPEQEGTWTASTSGATTPSKNHHVDGVHVTTSDAADGASPVEREDLSGLGKLRKWSLFACTCMIQFLLQLDMASVAVTLPVIAKDLNANQVVVFTVATGYLLAQTVFQLIFSHMSHSLGRKGAYLTGVGLYVTGATVAATSATTKQLVGGRVMQGIGAAGMYTMSAIITVEIMQLRQRAACASISQACAAVGNICGPLFAALLFKRFTWRSIFYMEIFFAGILFIALMGLVPRWRNRTTRHLRRLKDCDWIGMILFLVGSVATLVPINIGGAVQPWDSPAVAICFTVGGVSLVALALQQRFLAKNPAFPRQIFSRPETCVAFFGSLVSGMLLSMVFYNLVIFWEGVRHFSTAYVGIMLLSVTLTFAVSAAVTGVAIKVWGVIWWATVLGSVFAIVGLSLMAVYLTQTTPIPALVFICMTTAAGCGIFMPAMINTVLATTQKGWHSHAIATRTLLYTAGQCMGISVGLAIFTNKFASKIEKFNKYAGPNGLPLVGITPQNLLRVIKDLPPGSEAITLIVEALQWVWVSAIIMAAIAGLMVCWYMPPDLPKDGTTAVAETEADSENRVEDTRNRFALRTIAWKIVGSIKPNLKAIRAMAVSPFRSSESQSSGEPSEKRGSGSS